MYKTINMPIDESMIAKFRVGDILKINGDILVGRDTALPKLLKKIKEGTFTYTDSLRGALIFHSAVSVAGVGPTSSNKLEIESSILPLSKLGVKIHLGKGEISINTINELDKLGAIYAITPPISALLTDKILEKELLAFPEEGMEALYRLNVNEFPILIAAAHGESIYEERSDGQFRC